MNPVSQWNEQINEDLKPRCFMTCLSSTDTVRKCRGLGRGLCVLITWGDAQFPHVLFLYVIYHSCLQPTGLWSWIVYFDGCLQCLRCTFKYCQLYRHFCHCRFSQLVTSHFPEPKTPHSLGLYSYSVSFYWWFLGWFLDFWFFSLLRNLSCGIFGNSKELSGLWLGMVAHAHNPSTPEVQAHYRPASSTQRAGDASEACTVIELCGL